jgi:hypothetical protein
MEEILPPQLQRQVVFYRTTEAPGTIIVHTSERHLHLYVVQGNGVRCATASPQWQGLLKIARKQEWPDWKPPPKMIERQPYLPRFMAGGPGNPTGARALSRHDGLSYSRHQPAADHRQRGVLGVLSPGQCRCDRSLRSHSGRRQGDRPAEAEL